MALELYKLQLSGIDKNSPIPYHYQLTEAIREAILAGKWKHGDQLPSEREFCENFNISRITVRKALDVLVFEGMVQRVKGVGSFVSEIKYLEKWSGFPMGFTDSLERQGVKIETQVLSLEITLPSDDIATVLGLRSGDTVVFLHRLRFVSQEPILVVFSYLPQSLVPGLDEVDFTVKSLYQTLSTNYDLDIAKVKRGVEAVAATDMEAELLHIEPGTPMLQIESTSYLANGTPIEHFIARRRGDRTRFEFELSKPPDFHIT